MSSKRLIIIVFISVKKVQPFLSMKLW